MIHKLMSDPSRAALLQFLGPLLGYALHASIQAFLQFPCQNGYHMVSSNTEITPPMFREIGWLLSWLANEKGWWPALLKASHVKMLKSTKPNAWIQMPSNRLHRIGSGRCRWAQEQPQLSLLGSRLLYHLCHISLRYCQRDRLRNVLRHGKDLAGDHDPSLCSPLVLSFCFASHPACDDSELIFTCG